MANVRLKCPYCDTRERMELVGYKLWRGLSLEYASVALDAGEGGLIMTTSADCPECRKPFGLVIYFDSSQSPAALLRSKSNLDTDAAIGDAPIKVLSPPARLPELDAHLPEKVRKAFKYIEEDAQARRNPVGIMSGARGCLDVALKALGEESGGRRHRIDQLAEKGVITKDIATWSHRLWKEGSDAVHDLEATIEDAIEHVNFLRLFFEVAFALPARVARAAQQEIDSLVG